MKDSLWKIWRGMVCLKQTIPLQFFLQVAFNKFYLIHSWILSQICLTLFPLRAEKNNCTQFSKILNMNEVHPHWKNQCNVSEIKIHALFKLRGENLSHSEKSPVVLTKTLLLLLHAYANLCSKVCQSKVLTEKKLQNT